MSYEGYSQFLCKSGHYLGTRDCNDLRVETCPICQASVIENMVDQTNGCEVSWVRKPGSDPNKSSWNQEDRWENDFMPDPENHCQCGEKELFEIEAAKTCQCQCGNIHEIIPARYKFGEVHKVR